MMSVIGSDTGICFTMNIYLYYEIYGEYNAHQ